MDPIAQPSPPAAAATTSPAAAPDAAATPWPMPPTLDRVSFNLPEHDTTPPRGVTGEVNGLRDDTWWQEGWSRADGSLPDPVRDALYEHVVTKVNDVVFRSRPPGEPRPVEEGSWRLGITGDFGNGTAAMEDVLANVERWQPELVISAGDQVYPDSSARNWETKVDGPDQLGGLASRVPVLPAAGNHDIKPTADEYFRRFPYLEGSRYYSADYRNVHVVSVDTNQSLEPGSPQHEWLERDLAASDAPWKIVNIHHPMMSVISKVHYRETSKLPEQLGPLLAKYGVDLVVAGHEHWYERSRPLNDVGTIQLTAGGGGGALYPFPYPQQAWSATRDVDFGHVDLEVRGDDELVGRYVLRDGSVGDTFVVRNQTPRGWQAPGRDAADGAAATAAAG